MGYASPEFQNRRYTAEQVAQEIAAAAQETTDAAVMGERKRCQWIIANYGMNTPTTHALINSEQTPGEIAAAALAGTGPIPASLRGLAASPASACAEPAEVAAIYAAAKRM